MDHGIIHLIAVDSFNNFIPYDSVYISDSNGFYYFSNVQPAPNDPRDIQMVLFLNSIPGNGTIPAHITGQLMQGTMIQLQKRSNHIGLDVSGLSKGAYSLVK